MEADVDISTFIVTAAIGLYARNERGPTIKEDNYVDQYHYY